ncbi:MAG: flagellar basal-body rod protein FlgG [Ignavibacteria bacterium GWB2_35_12]|nr:MAG: flagellar basal-body rod protein FlgG [Ignavibacteria bacterium GWA2_35_8]OGU42683.1 MAG: flagellar basal-body rod protein FlgG [Ignavibacteria bacterium GWB2_35_12]OGU89381.1 MAG: flagellar basal-body rod protein FlgG [Ignavibacteria bacterium RIFOXYA2_FULL_35_10]OGV22752.1 MAG: flagellar basal-body rod protein FlgG [Ignavibacteria bacterium RIFOXYC2_FULL_35_21]
MDKTLRTAASGLTAQQRFVEIIANNLSNVNTTGFKKTRPEFHDLLYETLKPAGGNRTDGVEPLNEVQIGSGTELTATTKQFSQGDVKETSNPLDIAINGEGFFIIRKPDNSYAYSRDGSFQLDRNGQIVTSQGYFLEPGFNIPAETLAVTITRDGVVSVRTDVTEEEQTLGQIELARFINPAGLHAIGDNLFVETPASGKAIFEQPGINNTGELVQSHLEQSNVDVVEEMINMIVAQRAYELNSKAVTTAQELLNTAVNLKR